MRGRVPICAILLAALAGAVARAQTEAPQTQSPQTQPPKTSDKKTESIEVQPEPSPDEKARAAHKLPFKPELPNTGSNHRLILKDGSYQLVRKYEVVGDRVRYISTERGGEWEELPFDLVDWEATRKWEQTHTEQAEEAPSPAMKEAEEIDRETAASRAELASRRPEVSKGLELPDEDGVWILDTFQGTPELVELIPSEMTANARQRKGLETLNPLATSKADLEIEGTHARAHIHVNDPAIYLSLEGREDADKIIGRALTVDTGGARAVANRRHGARSPASGFAIVKLDERKAVRLVGVIQVGLGGTVKQSENVQPAKVEVLEGKHWLKITPTQPLVWGEYALVEIVSPSEINPQVWDFRADPRLADNPNALTPLLK